MQLFMLAIRVEYGVLHIHRYIQYRAELKLSDCTAENAVGVQPGDQMRCMYSPTEYALGSPTRLVTCHYRARQTTLHYRVRTLGTQVVYIHR